MMPAVFLTEPDFIVCLSILLREWLYTSYFSMDENFIRVNILGVFSVVQVIFKVSSVAAFLIRD